MLIILFALLLILAIAFYQAIQGVFSALVMTILTILAAAVAFNYYETLAAMLYETQPGYANAISLIALFVIPLLVVRIVFDKLIGGNVVLGNDMVSVWLGRVVAGGLGVVTAMVLIGVLLIAVQMLPFGRSIAGFEPFNGALNRAGGLVPFYPDEFTVGLVSKVSEGSLAGERPWRGVHDDLLLETYCTRNTAGMNGRCDTLPDAIRVVKVETLEDSPAFKGQWSMISKEQPAVGDEALGEKVIRVTTWVKTDKSARDEDDILRLPGTHFRLVCQDGSAYYPLAGAVTELIDQNDKPIEGLVSYKGNTSRGEPIYRDAINRYVTRAVPLEGADGKWDVAALGVFATMPDVIRSDDKKARPANLQVEWIYRIDPADVPDYMVFRSVAEAKVAAAKTAGSDE